MSTCHDHAQRRVHQLRREIGDLADALAEASGGRTTRLRLMLISRQRELAELRDGAA
jgi:hypothetical protein